MYSRILQNLGDEDALGLGAVFAGLSAVAAWLALWGVGVFSSWGQPLLLLIALLLFLFKPLLVVIFWTLAAPVLLVGTVHSLFWTPGPEITVPITLVEKHAEAGGGPAPGGYGSYVTAVDTLGRGWKFWTGERFSSLSVGDTTTVTYHETTFLGKPTLWRVVVWEIEWGPLNTYSRGNGIFKGFLVFLSAVPFGLIVWFWIGIRRRDSHVIRIQRV